MALRSRRKLSILRHQRLRRSVNGTAERPRLAVFRSNRHVYAQVIDDSTGRTLAAASSLHGALKTDLEGKPALEAAAAVGRAVAASAKGAGVTKVVFDRGGFKYHGCIKALADAAREAGLEL
jgi:large subunit ribosomal protein L18